MLRLLTLALCALVALLTGAPAAAQPDLPCPMEVIYDGIDRPLLVMPELWGAAGIRVTANLENPAPFKLVFVSKHGEILEGGQITVHPGSSVVVGSTEDIAILVRTLELPDVPPGTLCLQAAALPEEFYDIAVPGGCGGNFEHKSVRAEGWVSVTITVPDDQRCRVEVTLEAENPETGRRTPIGTVSAITGGTGVIEAYSPPPGYVGPTPFLRIRVECSFEPESQCHVTISGGFVPESDVHEIANVSVLAVCGGAVFDAVTSVPAVFDLAVENPGSAGNPACPLQVNIAFEGLPAGVPQPFPNPIDLAQGEQALIRLDNRVRKCTIRISVVCFFSPSGTCQPGISLGRGQQGTLGADFIWFDRECGEAGPRPLMMFSTAKPVTFTITVEPTSCPVSVYRADGQGGVPKKILTVQPGQVETDFAVKPRLTIRPFKRPFYELLTLYTQCEKSDAEFCEFTLNVAD